jgi:hypothetical protein
MMDDVVEIVAMAAACTARGEQPDEYDMATARAILSPRRRGLCGRAR